MIAPFLGASAGITTALILLQMLRSVGAKEEDYQELADFPELSLFSQQAGMPFFGCPKEPIGLLKDDRLILNGKWLCLFVIFFQQNNLKLLVPSSDGWY